MNFFNSHKTIIILLLSMMAIVESTFAKSKSVEQPSTKLKNHSLQKSDIPNTSLYLIAGIVEEDRGEEDCHTYPDFTSSFPYLNNFSIDFLGVKKLTLISAESAPFIPKQKRNILYCTFLI